MSETEELVQQCARAMYESDEHLFRWSELNARERSRFEAMARACLKAADAARSRAGEGDGGE